MRAPTPGTVLRVRSIRMPLIEHWGMVYWREPLTGDLQMIHGMKNDVFKITSMFEFSSGQVSNVAWAPKNTQEQVNAIRRMETLIGQRWDLLRLNCEQGVMWALTGKKTSKQLDGGVIVAGLVMAGIAISRS